VWTESRVPTSYVSYFSPMRTDVTDAVSLVLSMVEPQHWDTMIQ
jgi:hypothetical protein